MKKIISALAFLLLLIPLVGQAITISPPLINLELAPGESKQINLLLYNETAKNLYLSGSVEPFKPQGEEGRPVFYADNVIIPAVSWLKFSNSSFTLKPNQGAQVPVTVTVPKTADVGGYYLAVMWRAAESKEAGQLSLASRVGALLLLKVTGNVKEELGITEFNARNGENMYNFLPVQFVSRIKNKGNVHEQPQGLIIIKNLFGQVLDSLPFNPDGGNILPQSLRKFENTWSNPRQFSGRGLFVDWQKELQWKYWGRLTAKLFIEYGENRQKAESKEIGLWVLPYRTLAVLISLLLVLFIWLFIRWLKKRHFKII